MSDLQPPLPPRPDAASAEGEALLRAMQGLLLPMARLAVAKGLRFASVEESLKQAFVQAATEALLQAHPDLLAHRLVSRISTITGINRREVTRLTNEHSDLPAPRPSVTTEVFTRWLTDPRYREGDQAAAALRRQGDAPSFESLARSVTQDVHPRSMLDELCRLGLVRWDEATDLVHLEHHAFVPRGDAEKMLAFLGENVGDHLSAAVANVLAKKSPPHFEQAVFSDDLSLESMPAIKALVRTQWQNLLGESIPLLERLIKEDREQGRQQDQRVRIGLFSYSEQRPTGPQQETDNKGN